MANNNNNISEEFSQELSDLKWQFGNMQQIFSNLENTITQAKKTSNYEEDSEDNNQNRDIFSNQFGKGSNSKEDNPKEDKSKEDKSKEAKSKEGDSKDSDSKENNSKQDSQNSQNGMKSNNDSTSNNDTSKLSSQIQTFMKETQTQQLNLQQEIQKSIQQAMNILTQVNVQIETNQALIMMNQFINQAEEQIKHITKNNKSSSSSSGRQPSK